MSVETNNPNQNVQKDSRCPSCGSEVYEGDPDFRYWECGFPTCSVIMCDLCVNSCECDRYFCKTHITYRPNPYDEDLHDHGERKLRRQRYARFFG